MPLYDFRCKRCKKIKEGTEAPSCHGKEMERVYGFNVAWTNLPTRGGKSMDKRKKPKNS